MKYEGFGVTAEVGYYGKIAFVFVQEEKNFGNYIFEMKAENDWITLQKFTFDDLKKYAFFHQLKEYEDKASFRLRNTERNLVLVQFDFVFPKRIELLYHRVCDSLHFSEKADYELYDKFGKLLQKGNAKDVNVAKLERDVYYIICGYQSFEFIKSCRGN